MPVLSTKEAVQATDCFLLSVYGNELFERWLELKRLMKFESEREYVSWLMDVAYHYQTLEGDEQQAFEGYDGYSTAGESPGVVQMGADLQPVQQQQQHEKLQQHAEREGEGALPVVQHPPHRHLQQHQQQQQQQHQHSSINYSVQENTGIMEDKVYTGEMEPKPHGSSSLSFGESDQAHLPADDSMATDNGLGIVALPSGTDSLRDKLGNQKLNSCNYCHYTTKDRSNLRKHVKSVHLKLKNHSCPHCDYRCSEKLLPHLISKHGYKPKFACETCGKGFARQSQLTMHTQKCTLPLAAALVQ